MQITTTHAKRTSGPWSAALECTPVRGASERVIFDGLPVCGRVQFCVEGLERTKDAPRITHVFIGPSILPIRAAVHDLARIEFEAHGSQIMFTLDYAEDAPPFTLSLREVQ
jgi:hypothetical protein